MENGSSNSMAIYKSTNFTNGCLEIRLFYVRITPCDVAAVPDHLTLRHLRREMGVTLDINNSRIPSAETASITLRRDRVNKDSSEVTYVSTDSVRVSGPIEFEVKQDEEEGVIILCGSLERVDDATWTNGNVLENDLRTGWSMDCYVAAGLNGFGVGSPCVEVYIAGCCSGVPVILTKTIQVSPRRKAAGSGSGSRHGVLLDAIPEDEEVGKEEICGNGFIRQRKLQITETDADDYDSEGKLGNNSFYSEDMYSGEDGQLSWFNAGVRVGVGIGLGMCLGVGIGVGLLMRSYQATTRSFRRRFF